MVKSPGEVINAKFDPNPANVEHYVTELSSVFVTTMEKSLKAKKSNKLRKVRNRECRHFNKDCREAKRIVNKYRHLITKELFSRQTREKYFISLKNYKQTIRKAKKDQERELIEQLQELESKDPKQYWSLVNALRGISKKKSNKSICAYEWQDHFTKLLNNNYNTSCNQAKINDIKLKIKSLMQEKHFDELDYQFTKPELMQCVRKLKTGKSPGLDSIINEVIKILAEPMSEALLTLFNLIYNSGHYPNNWRKAVIIPIYKKSGSFSDPEKYRGIVLMSCLAKPFHSLLNNRLVNYLKKHSVLSEFQIGFMKGYRTTDHIFVLRFLIDNYVKRCKKDIFAAFIDFSKAFDRIWRDALVLKLLQSGVRGRMIRIIENMYRTTEYGVKCQGGITPFFASSLGVRQGCNLSPTLFNIFINDIRNIFTGIKGFSVGGKEVNFLLYADDLIVICKSGKDLQNCLDRLEHYTETWNLGVNIDKSKVLVFTKKRTPKLNITISGKVLGQVEEFIYLGVNFNKTGNFAKTSEYMRIKAQKALFSLTRSLIYKPIPISTMLKIFDKTIMPILLYGSDVWGTFSLKYKNIYSENQMLVPEKAYLSLEVEKLCLKFFKQLIGVHRNTTSIAVLSELGRFPCQIICIINIIKYWHRISLMDKDSLLYNTFKSQLEIIEGNNDGYHLWLHFV